MLLTKTVILRWNPKIKKHYVDLGYKFTKMGDEFEVNVSDLTKGSSVLVEVECDYCGKHYTKTWVRYIYENEKSTIHTDCCDDCKKYKTMESNQLRYGVNSVLEIPSIKEKVADTNKKLYGTKNPFASDVIKEKIRETNIQKFGTPSAMQNETIKQKAIKTCMDRYGVDYYVRTQVFIGEDNPRWKGGISVLRNERATNEYISWRKSVFAKDHYTCQCCGATSGYGRTILLHAHHIKNWKDNPDDRYDVENGITLCDECHYKFHSEYGKRDNTKSQIESFINKQGKKIC